MTIIQNMAKRVGEAKSAVGYLRVSTEEQRLGPVDQAKALEQWAAREGVTLTAVFFDFGVSGKAPIAKRPGLLRAIIHLREANAGVLLLKDRSRIGRDVEVVRAIERETVKAGALLRTTDGMSDGEGSGGFLTKSMQDVINEHERMRISERTKAALAVLKARGRKAGQVPYGFRAVEDGTTTDKHGITRPSFKLEALEAEQALVSHVRSLSASGLSTRKIVAQLVTEGHQTRKGTSFAQTQIVRMLQAS